MEGFFTVNESTPNVVLIELTNAKKRNALTQPMLAGLMSCLRHHEKRADIRAIVLTGGENFFCAGADISILTTITSTEAYTTKYLEEVRSEISSLRTPVIAAVNGFALGGGFELALACHIIFAADNATFGLPEVTIGTIPGAGGTQRLARAVGTNKAMNMILRGRRMSAIEGERAGLVAEVWPKGEVLNKAIEAAQEIARLPSVAVSMAMDCVKQAEEKSLSDGIEHERNLYFLTFATADQKEGAKSFVEKREPGWKHC